MTTPTTLPLLYSCMHCQTPAGREISALLFGLCSSVECTDFFFTLPVRLSYYWIKCPQPRTPTTFLISLSSSLSKYVTIQVKLQGMKLVEDNLTHNYNIVKITIQRNNITCRESKCCRVQYWTLHLPVHSFCVLCHQTLYSSSVKQTYTVQVKTWTKITFQWFQILHSSLYCGLQKHVWEAIGFHFQARWGKLREQCSRLLQLESKCPWRRW